MLTTVTWIAVVVLAVGSLGVFVFFVRDIPKVIPRRRDDDEAGHGNPPTGS